MKVASYEMQSRIAHLKNKNIFGVLLYGHNYGLVVSIADDISNYFVKEGFVINRLHSGDIEKNESILLNSVTNLGLFDDAKVIIISQASNKLDLIVKDLLNLDFNQKEKVMLVICAGELDTKSKLRMMFEEGEDILSVACYYDDVESSKQVARRFFNEKKIICSEAVLNLIAENATGDRGSLMNDLEKISMYVGEDIGHSLTENEVLDLLFETKEAIVNDLIDVLAIKNVNSAISKMEDLIYSDIEAVVIVKNLIAHFTQLMDMLRDIKLGKNIDIVIKSHRIFFKRIGSYRKQLSMWSIEEISAILIKLADMEVIVKAFSSDKNIIEATMKQFILQSIHMGL